MRKKNSKYFYVEMKGKNDNPIFHHTIEKRRGELLYKFDTEFDAKLFLDTLVNKYPNDKFRIVKIEETYFPSKWYCGGGNK